MVNLSDLKFNENGTMLDEALVVLTVISAFLKWAKELGQRVYNAISKIAMMIKEFIRRHILKQEA